MEVILQSTFSRTFTSFSKQKRVNANGHNSWLSVGGAFSQPLAQSGYKKRTALGKEFNQPVLLKLLCQMFDCQENWPA